ncbi:hypothetical protein FRC06_006258, partial [Ceratobasidium sp. 370]
MKIGEAGEAFFVFETDEEVPEELMTSPLLEPVRPGQSSKTVTGADRPAGRFGAKKARAEEERLLLNDVLVAGDEDPRLGATSDQEPEFLDLSEPSAPRPRRYSPTPSLSPPTSTSTLASSTLPVSTPPNERGSLPQSFLSKTLKATKAAAHIVTEEIGEKKDVAYDLLRYGKGPGGVEGVDASDGVDEQEAAKLREAAQPPEIRYTQNVVLDMAGYHSKSQVEGDSDSLTEPESPPQPRRPSLSVRQPSDATKAGLSTTRASSGHLMRGKSEEHLVSSQGDYSWEWGAMPKLFKDISPSASTIRGSSSPSVNKIPLDEPCTPPSVHIGLGRPPGAGAPRPVSEPDSLFGGGGRLVGGDLESGEPIAMEHDGIRRLAFDLSLCGPIDSSVDPPEAAKVFADSKITLQRLIGDAAVVHDERLVIRWDDKYISRRDGTPLFDALVAWRDNTLAQRASAALSSRRARSSWLWWGRSRSDRAGKAGGDVSEGPQRLGLRDSPSAPAGLGL